MPYILKKYYPARNIAFFLGEGLLIFAAISGVYLFAEGFAHYTDALHLYVLRAALVTIVFQVCLYYFDLYDLSIIPSYSDTATRITQAFGFGCILLALLYYLFPVTTISTRIFLIGYAFVCGVIAVWRFLYILVLDRRMFSMPILLLGQGMLFDSIASEIQNRQDSGYSIAALAPVGTAPVTVTAPVITAMATLPEYVDTHKIEKIVVALDDRRGTMPIAELMACKLKGVAIAMGIDFYERLTGKIMVERVNPAKIIFSTAFRKKRSTYILKRLTDILVSGIGILLTLPLWIVSAVIIKLESPGPIFYTQERVGAKDTTFQVIKFRSMRADAEKDGPVWAAKQDPRVTRYGGIMRKLRIDEIPQMWSVLKGDMSFVGPRPERPVFVRELEKKIPYYSLRHTIKPGLTGWAQVFYPYGASEEDALRKLEYDLYYIMNMSIVMDFWIIFETVKIVLFQKGAR